MLGMSVAAVAIVGAVVVPAVDWPWSSPRSDGDLPWCGSVTIGVGSGSGEVPADREACWFGSEADRRGAELEVLRTTTEGAPVRVYYRNHPGEPGLQVMEDSTDDPYGSGGWTVSSCPDATAVDSLGVCEVA